MLRTRVIPCLLLKNGGLVKSIGFKNPRYVGDPINAVRIFNEKEVDELILLDIEASRERKTPNYTLIKDIVSEAFMPVAYGGGISTVEQAQHIVNLGVEKIVINSAALRNLSLIRAIADQLGSSSTVVAVDVRRDWRGRYRTFDAVASKDTDKDPLEHLQGAVAAGAGEVFINDVTRDGTRSGFDLNLVEMVSTSVTVPFIVCGGAGTLEHLREAIGAGASAVSAGSMFVYVGKHQAVMINYPERHTLEELFKHD